jgi:hypothetical protein
MLYGLVPPFRSKIFFSLEVVSVYARDAASALYSVRLTD